MSITSAKFFAVACLIVGVVTLGTQWTVVPAAAEGQGTQVITLQATAAALAELTFVALLDDEREGGAERREGERREDAEGREREQPRREGEGARREGEARREGDRPREGEGRREGFRPQTENEEMLYRMILQLQREVVELRNALRYRLAEPRREAGERERDLPRRDADQPRREGDQPRREGDRPAPTREGERRDSDQE